MNMSSSSSSAFHRPVSALQAPAKRENVRSVTYHPHLEHKDGLKQELPDNYMDPRGKFPAKDAYISNLKSQFFSLGFSFGSAFQYVI